MKWTVHGERSVYDSEWMGVSLVDVELPSGRRFEHHVLRMPCAAAGVVVDDADRGVLLLWRHRFISDTWGWEVPAGRVDPGETPAECGGRETLEETGWRPGPLTELTSYRPHNGTSDARFHLFHASSAERVGDPVDTDEAERVEWLGWNDVRDEMLAGRIGDGLSLTALLWCATFAPN
jgi:8-oxo-dGTP pyrophosphatase MutT (NUDIX family)